MMFSALPKWVRPFLSGYDLILAAFEKSIYDGRRREKLVKMVPLPDWWLIEENFMSYTIVSDICEGIADCIPVCPVECIHWTEKTNEKGHKYPYIDDSTCIDCGACLSACPVEGAILDGWK